MLQATLCIVAEGACVGVYEVDPLCVGGQHWLVSALESG